MPRPPRRKSQQGEKKLTFKERLSSLLRIAKISYQTAPSVLYVRIISAILDSLLPIATTYFAAQTTTELARAYNGETGAGEMAIFYVIITAALGIVTTIWSSVTRYISRMAQFKLRAAVDDRLTSQFLRLDFWRYDKKETADLLDKSRQFSNLFTYIFDTLGNIVTSLVSLISSIIALLFVDWWLSVLLLIAVIPGLFIQYRLSKQRVKQWSENVETRRKESYISWQLQDIKGIAELRLYGLVKHLLKLRQNYREKDEKARILIERKFIWKETLASVIESIAEVVALIFITLRIIAHAQPIGQFLYVQQIFGRGLSAVGSVMSSFINIDEDLANLYAYDEFMELPVEKPGKKKITAAPSEISLDSVSFAYPSAEIEVLKDISLKISQGQHVAIVGENGAGKSTLVKLLLGLYVPTKGSVMIGGIDTKSLNLESWHALVGVLQQSAIQFDFASARENVLFGDLDHPISKKRYDMALEKAESKEFIRKLPKKDDSYISQWMEGDDGVSGVALSGGQQQRLALARSFYRDSPVVILDEPTSAIDALAESRIFKKLFEEKDKTIITISHRLSTVRRADYIYVLEHGKIVEQGKHAELVKNHAEYYRLFESQL